MQGQFVRAVKQSRQPVSIHMADKLDRAFSGIDVNFFAQIDFFIANAKIGIRRYVRFHGISRIFRRFVINCQQLFQRVKPGISVRFFRQGRFRFIMAAAVPCQKQQAQNNNKSEFHK